MRTIIGAAFVSLDGVMQAPGGPSEDPTLGFGHGGWVAPLADEGFGAELDDLFGRDYDLLLGRRTYDIFAAYWPYAPDEMADMRDAFDRCTKYVVTGSDTPLEWQNSRRVSIDDIAEIKAAEGPDIIIQGSSTLYPQLLERDLIDRLSVMTFPVLLGSGKRLFGDGTPARTLRKVADRVSGNTVIATYEPVGAVVTQAIAEQSTSERERRRQDLIARGDW